MTFGASSTCSLSSIKVSETERTHARTHAYSHNHTGHLPWRKLKSKEDIGEMKKQYHNASLVAGQSHVTNTPTPLTVKSIKPFSPYPSPRAAARVPQLHGAPDVAAVRVALPFPHTKFVTIWAGTRTLLITSKLTPGNATVQLC